MTCRHFKGNYGTACETDRVSERDGSEPKLPPSDDFHPEKLNAFQHPKNVFTNTYFLGKNVKKGAGPSSRMPMADSKYPKPRSSRCCA